MPFLNHGVYSKGDFETLSTVIMLPKNWVHLLVVIKPIDTTKPKIRRRKDLLLAASKQNTRDLSRSRVSLNSKIGDVLS